VEAATAVFNDYDLRNYVIDVRKKYDQIIDHINPDEIVKIGWVKDSVAGAQSLITEFTAWIEAHKNEITALQIFYGQPYRRRELTYKMINDLFELLTREKPVIKLSKIWDAYTAVEDEDMKGKLVKRLPRTEKPKQELILLVSLLRKAIGMDDWVTNYETTVDRNFQEWVFKKQAGNLKFTQEQMQWLRMMKDYIATSFHIERDDFDFSPFNANGGLSKMWQLFGEKTDEIIGELNEALAA
jgi:type I restriction enzyme, R subunit